MESLKLHQIWSGMKSRCKYKSDKSYKDYGGRGISVSEEWDTSFIAFYEWSLKNGYKIGLCLDRIDNNGNYSPQNCQWVTRGYNGSVGKRRKRKDNTSGYTGIYRRGENKYQVGINVCGKWISIGRFTALHSAIQARINAEKLYFGEQKTNINGM